MQDSDCLITAGHWSGSFLGLIAGFGALTLLVGGRKGILPVKTEW